MLELDIRARVGGFALEVAFDAFKGEILGLFGPSGTGKSLTLRAVAGLLRPDAGRIVMNGRTLFDSAGRVNEPPQARGVGYVPQDYALFPHLTVAENIAFGLNGSRLQQLESVEEMLDLMRLQGLEAHRPRELSGGQQQRVAIARALVRKPGILLLDEPFAALDAAIRSRLQGELLAVQRRFGIPTLLVTHDLGEAYSLSDRLAVLDGGKLLQIGPKEEVLRRPVNRSVARFVGTKNIFGGTITGSAGHRVTMEWADNTIEAPSGRYGVGHHVTWCIRPEDIMIVRPDRPLRPSVQRNLIGGHLVREIDRGVSHLLFFKANGVSGRDYDLEILLPHHAHARLGLRVGQSMVVSLKASAIHLMPNGCAERISKESAMRETGASVCPASPAWRSRGVAATVQPQ